jgi:hypothetical protein
MVRNLLFSQCFQDNSWGIFPSGNRLVFFCIAEARIDSTVQTSLSFKKNTGSCHTKMARLMCVYH